MTLPTETAVSIVGADSRWDDHILRASGDLPDVYFSSAYHRLHQLAGDGVPFCTAMEHNGTELVVPGLRVPIPGTNLWDLQSCNGYGGPLAPPGTAQPMLVSMWTEWMRESRELGAVAAFFRLHPLQGNEQWLPPYAEVRDDRYTVYVPLNAGLDVAWTNAESRHRNMVTRAQRAGAAPTWNDTRAWACFPELYRAAMTRADAPARLRFDSRFFSLLRSMPSAEIVSVEDEVGIACAAIFLFGPRWGHYHLSARRADAPNYVGNLILQAGIERASVKGLNGLHLGGGVTPAMDDPLLRFKRSVGGELKRFRTGRVICNQPAFDQLASRSGASRWLLPYRDPLGSAPTNA